MAEIIDPQRSTSAQVNRRAFVGLTAGATIGAASVAQALAQGVELGKVHTPLVAEDDPAITTSRPVLTKNGRSVHAYAAAPNDAGPNTPGVVCVMHIWGVDTSMRDFARRLAKAGYVAIIPDLYEGLGAPNGDGTTNYTPFAAVAANLVDATVDNDLHAGGEWIRTHHANAKIGVSGFCMGGGISLRQAVDSPDIFSACSVFYGKVRYATGGGQGSTKGPATEMALAYADKIHIPLIGSWGGRDTGIPAADIPQLQKKLSVPNDLKVYPEAGHAFFDDQRESYVATAAEDAWSRLLKFFGTYLK